MQFKPIELGIEVSGRAVYSTLAGLQNLKISPENDLLNIGIGNGENGISSIEIDKWYSQELWLKMFEMIARMYGDNILYKIGTNIPDNAVFPDLGDNIENAIKTIDIAYHMNHKKDGKIMYNESDKSMIEGIGHYGCHNVEGFNIIVSECNNPYPCSFDKGILAAVAKKIEPTAIVFHDDSKPCRKNGANSCIYIITW